MIMLWFTGARQPPACFPPSCEEIPCAGKMARGLVFRSLGESNLFWFHLPSLVLIESFSELQCDDSHEQSLKRTERYTYTPTTSHVHQLVIS